MEGIDMEPQAVVALHSAHRLVPASDNRFANGTDLLPNGSATVGVPTPAGCMRMNDEVPWQRGLQLVGLEQESRIRRAAVTCRVALEGGLQQHATCIDGVEDAGQYRPPEIVDDH